MSCSAAEQDPLQLGERTMRHEHSLAAGENAPIRKVTNRQPIRISGDHPHAVVLGGDEHSRDHTASLIGARRTNDLPERIGEIRRRQRDRFGGRVDLCRVVLDVVVAQ